MLALRGRRLPKQPVQILVAASYITARSQTPALPLRPGENVQLIPGHKLPDRFAVMLGAIGLLGAAVVGAEALRGSKEAEKETPKHDIRRAS